MHSALAREGLRFLVHPKVDVRVGGAWRRLQPDVLVPSERLAIEVNGCFVHGCPECEGDRGRDRLLLHERKVRALENAGLEVLTIWECEIEEGFEVGDPMSHDGAPIAGTRSP